MGLISGVLWGAYALIGLAIERQVSPVQAQINRDLNSLDRDLSGKIASLDKRVAILELSHANQVVAQLKEAPSSVIKQHAEEIQQAKQQLAQVPTQDMPGYWPTSFGVLHLASVASSPLLTINLEHANTVNDAEGIDGGSGNTYILSGHVAHSRFSNSVIVFDPRARLADVLFVECVFVFPENTANPTPQLANIGSKLLQAQNIGNVTLTTS